MIYKSASSFPFEDNVVWFLIATERYVREESWKLLYSLSSQTIMEQLGLRVRPHSCKLSVSSAPWV